MGSICVSSVSGVGGWFTILSAVFGVISRLWKAVSDAISDHIIWKRTQVWVLVLLCMLRVLFPFISPCS